MHMTTNLNLEQRNDELQPHVIFQERILCQLKSIANQIKTYTYDFYPPCDKKATPAHLHEF